MKIINIILDSLSFILFTICSIMGFMQGNITTGLGWSVAVLTLIRVVLTKRPYNEYKI